MANYAKRTYAEVDACRMMEEQGMSPQEAFLELVRRGCPPPIAQEAVRRAQQRPDRWSTILLMIVLGIGGIALGVAMGSVVIALACLVLLVFGVCTAINRLRGK